MEAGSPALPAGCFSRAFQTAAVSVAEAMGYAREALPIVLDELAAAEP